MTAFQQDERSEERVISPPDEPCGESSETADSGLASAAARARALLTFRLDLEFRQRLRARLAGEGRSLSEVVIHGLQLYLQQAMSSREEQATPSREEEDASPAPTSAPVPAKSAGPAAMAVASVADLALPDAHPDHGRRGAGAPRRVGRHRERGRGRTHGLRGRLVLHPARHLGVRRRARHEGPRPSRR